MTSRPFRFMCVSCSRSQTNQTCHYYCNYCNHDWKLFRELGALIRAAFPELHDQADIELVARAWRNVCASREELSEYHLDKAEALLARADTHIQLSFADVKPSLQTAATTGAKVRGNDSPLDNPDDLF